MFRITITQLYRENGDLDVFLIGFLDDTPHNGYYNYENEEYYFQKSSWYYYDDMTDDWQPLDSSLAPSELITFGTGSEYHTYSHEGKAFEDSKWYVEDSDDDYESDWDNDYDWDSDDSWDSGDTDWDTDW